MAYCFYGPACPGSLDDPCQPYKLPPAIPFVYTLYYNSKVTVCSPMGCHDTYISGRQLLNLTEHKKRDDTYERFWSSIFVLPGNVSGFNQVNILSLGFATVEGLFQARWQGGCYLLSYLPKCALKEMAILAILVSNRVWLLFSSIELDMLFFA